MRLATSSAAILACILLPLSLAHAQDAAATEARAAFEAGQAAYEAGRFDAALSYFERAYELTSEPDVLYNIATVHDRLRHDREALEAYRGYLEGRPDAPDRANVEARIEALEATLSEPEPEPEPEPNLEPEPDPEPPAPPAPETHVVTRDPGPGPWVLVGVGGAIAVAGGVLVGVAFGDIAAVESGPPRPWGEVADAADRAPVLSGVGFAAIGAGVAALAAGLVWVAVGGGQEEVQVGVGPGGVRIGGRF